MQTARRFQLRYEQDGVYLRVQPAEDGGEIHYGDLMRYLESKGVRDTFADGISAALQFPGSDARIAPPQEEHKLDELANVTISPDEMTAFITFTPADGGKLLLLEEIVDLLEEKGVVYGLQSSVLAMLEGNEEKEYHVPIPVAQGDVPIAGDDAWVEYHFRLIRDKAPRMLEDGTVDHKNLDLIDNVVAGDLLATLHLETPGIPGMDVVGKPIPSMRGRAAVLPKGNLTQISEDGLHLVATVDGRVEMIGGKVTVVKVLEIHSDVGTATGNITFKGDVVVHGNVLSRYSVTATGSIEVDGIIEAAAVKAGGNVVVRQGVKGMGICDIDAGGDITAKFIENAQVNAGGTVRADVIMHSRVTCYRQVVVAGRRGLLVGGITSACQDIAAYTIGTGAGTATALEVGVTPDMRKRMTRLRGDIQLYEKELLNTNRQAARLRSLKAMGRTTAEQIASLEKMEAHLREVEDALPARKAEFEILTELLGKNQAGRVHAKEVIYPNVTITIGSVVEKIPKPWRATSFYREAGIIAADSYAFSGT